MILLKKKKDTYDDQVIREFVNIRSGVLYSFIYPLISCNSNKNSLEFFLKEN